MSNHLAIATVTAALQRAIQAAVQANVDGARVTTVKPTDIGNGTPETGVNLFSYQVVNNPALSNVDAPRHRNKGDFTRRKMALELHYMVSVYGDENELIPQRLMGSVLRILNEIGDIPSELIRETCEDATLSFLEGSTLADELQQMTVMALDFNLDELSKTWSIFFQAPYILSMAYKVMVVMLESETPLQVGLPIIGKPQIGGASPYLDQPVIEQVIASAGRLAPIMIDSTLRIQGKNLKGLHRTLIRIGGIEVSPTAAKATELTLRLTDIPTQALRVGLQSLQVLHPPAPGSLPQGSPRYGLGVESNAAPFILRPTAESVSVSLAESDDDENCIGAVVAQLNLPIGAQQRIVMFLNELSTEQPKSYVFDKGVIDPDQPNQVTISFQDVQPGDYLVRIQVDGAESQLVVDDAPNSPTHNQFIGPRVTIS
ncbi:MAG: DUF4255 domain-containing protein [Leptolyngbyaceae cyanobacterium]